MSNTSSFKLPNAVSAMEGSLPLLTCRNGCPAKRTRSSKRSMVGLRLIVQSLYEHQELPLCKG